MLFSLIAAVSIGSVSVLGQSVSDTLFNATDELSLIEDLVEESGNTEQ